MTVKKTDGTAEVKPASAAFTDEPPVTPAKLQGLDLGPACGQCGGMMQRTGSCYTCSSCGNNTGCGVGAHSQVWVAPGASLA